LISGKSEHFVDGVVLSYFGHQDIAICSSEYFAALSSSQWARLLQSTKRIGAELKVIIYVRSVLPFLVSVYDQAIKRHGEWRRFSEWVILAEWQHFSSLQAIDAALPRSSLRVLSYDREKSGLIDSFLKALDIDSSVKASQEKAAGIVNRSLTTPERDILRHVNANLGAVYGKELSDILISKYPHVPSQFHEYDVAMNAFLREKFDREVAWVNDNYFGGEPVVSVCSFDPGKASVESHFNKEVGPTAEHLERLVLNWSLETLRTIKEETSRRILSALTTAACHAKGDLRSDLPADFDPIAYLCLNPDVAMAEADPVLHYLEFGRSEGRQYKSPERESCLTPAQEELDTLQGKIEIASRLVEQWRIHANEAAREAAERERMLAAQLVTFSSVVPRRFEWM
jgi:hypothetical protein